MKYYVGQTTQDPKIRFKQHQRSNSKIGNAIRKNKNNNVTYKILKDGYYTKKELDKLESEYISKYKSYEYGYNQTRGNHYKK